MTLFNLARMTTATTGTGAITLGSAVDGYLSFEDAGVSDGETVSYSIQCPLGSEVGVGVYTSATTSMTRSVTKSTNSDAALDLNGNDQEVALVVLAADIPAIRTYGIEDDNAVEVDGSPADDELARWTANGLEGVTGTVTAQEIALTSYDPSPSRSSESNIHGGIRQLADNKPLNVGNPINVTKGIGKIIIVAPSGTDFAGTITVTGKTVNRNTGATTAGDTDTIVVDTLSTDNSDTDSNGNVRHSFTNAYITSKWFVGAVVISTTNLTLTNVDVWHISFEQFNDQAGLTVSTFDANIYTTNVNAEFDAYLYAVEVTGSKVNVSRLASLNVGAGGETAIANRYWRLRRGLLGKELDGTTDGIWVDVFYSNSPAYVEDVSVKVWASRTLAFTLS